MEYWTDPYDKVRVEKGKITAALAWLQSTLGPQGNGWYRSGENEFCFPNEKHALMLVFLCGRALIGRKTGGK